MNGQYPTWGALKNELKRWYKKNRQNIFFSVGMVSLGLATIFFLYILI